MADFRLTTQHRNAATIACLTAAGLVVCSAGVVLGVSWYVDVSADPRVYSDLEGLPERDVGLVLGTSRNRGSGLNEFYAGRISAAAELYHTGKIRHVIVSGSNPSQYYNEPVVMKRDLVAAGVPADSITEDYAGLRTLDSVVRAHKVMGQSAFTVISQRFHAERAVFIGTKLGLDVVAYCAKDASGPELLSAKLREYGARFKALLDVMVLDTQPKFLGQPVAIKLQPESTTALD